MLRVPPTSHLRTHRLAEVMMIIIMMMMNHMYGVIVILTLITVMMIWMRVILLTSVMMDAHLGEKRILGVVLTLLRHMTLPIILLCHLAIVVYLFLGIP
jgi:hypothetical protein